MYENVWRNVKILFLGPAAQEGGGRAGRQEGGERIGDCPEILRLREIVNKGGSS
jgi:hypothetical protein